jgi:predicted small metal-binding protein
MAAVRERLVRQEDRLILLFTPPFDRTPRDPGYIKGYPLGVRENGGQYTHAALWAIWAWAKLGQGDYAESLFQLINPIYHSSTPQKAGRYRVEPYVVAADVYGAPPHTGRGGWTWYTGSAAWMYRLGLEAILGLTRTGDTLHIEPCIPKTWPDYQLIYRVGDTYFHIQVENPDGVNSGVKQVELDGEILPDGQIPLSLDGRRHQVRVLMGNGGIKERRYTMERELSCNALGVANCDYVARGESAADVVEAMVNHLEDKHGIDMPDIEDIMQGTDHAGVFEERDPAANLMVRRMRETLNLQDENIDDGPEPGVAKPLPRTG